MLTDYQGNWYKVITETGTTVEQYSFDAWGKRRNATNWSYTGVPTTFTFDRGYTGHEMLDAFGLINMNGRVYDPVIARFLSPDNYVQSTTSSQGFNRYSYCLNNPLSYNDPSGEFIHIIIGAAVGGIINLGIKAYQGKIHNLGDGIVAFGIGAAAGAVGAATGGAAFAAAGGAAGGVGGFLAGAAGGAVGTAAASPIQSIGNSVYFGDPMMTPKQYLVGIGIGAFTGGTINGTIALFNGRAFLNGLPDPSPPTITRLPFPDQYHKAVIEMPGNGRAQLSSMPEQNSYSLNTSSSENYISPIEGKGMTFNVERPEITGYDASLATKTDLFHNFPTSLDKILVQDGSMAYRVKDGAYMFTAPGSIQSAQGTFEGIYTIGVNQSGMVFHKCFYDWATFLKKF